LRIDCQNGIPVSSGLGSSAAAILTGLLGAAALLDVPLPPGEALALAARMEGHADNAAAALHGGLVVVAAGARGWITRRIEIPATGAVVVVPSVPLSTHTARTALPQEISLRDATFNLGRAILVVEALRSGDLDLLRQAIDDRLHLPYRLPMIPGGAEAMQQAAAAGASAVTISGAGPSLIAFASANQAAIGETMACAFLQAGIPARVFLVTTTGLAAHIAQ
jgi:homoserine kinase